MFVHALIRVSVLGVALPTSSAFISVEVTNLHGEAWCCLSLHVRLAWGGTESWLMDLMSGQACIVWLKTGGRLVTSSLIELRS